MDDQGNNTPSESVSGSQTTHKRVRRATRLKELTRSRNAQERKPIEFNPKTGRPIGPHRQRFTSYVGFLARSKVSILKNEWDQVEDNVKDLIWKSILVCHYNFLFFVSSISRYAI